MVDFGMNASTLIRLIIYLMLSKEFKNSLLPTYRCRLLLLPFAPIFVFGERLVTFRLIVTS